MKPIESTSELVGFLKAMLEVQKYANEHVITESDGLKLNVTDLFAWMGEVIDTVSLNPLFKSQRGK